MRLVQAAALDTIPHLVAAVNTIIKRVSGLIQALDRHSLPSHGGEMLIDEVDGVMEFLSQQERGRLDVVNDIGRVAARPFLSL